MTNITKTIVPPQCFTLQYYLSNTSKYFKPQTELWFKQGHYSLYEDWVLQNVSNFIINGNNSTLSCSKPSLGIAVINVTNITIKALHIEQCSKYQHYTSIKNYKSRYLPVFSKSSIFIYLSADVVISNTSIIIHDHNTTGIIGINIVTRNLSTSSFTNITVLVLCENNTNNLVSGIMLYHNDDSKNFTTLKTIITIKQYNYKAFGLCSKSCALQLIMMHKAYNIIIKVKDTTFNDLFNSSILVYYGEACRDVYKQSFLIFSNCKVINNIGSKIIDMFLIEIHSHDNVFDIVKSNHLCSNLSNFITLRNCDFINNTRINSLINMVLKHNEQLNVFVKIRNSTISFNNDLQLINTDSELKLLKALSYIIIISATKILSNSCAAKDRISLISLTSGIIKIEDSVIAHNTNFENIIQLHSSLLQFERVHIFFKEPCKIYITRNGRITFCAHRICNSKLDQ